jgi:hypothetical protein
VRPTVTLIACSVMLWAAACAAHGQSFSLDDNPRSPLTSPPGVFPGLGAEDEFGLTGGLGLAPSPSLPLAPGALDGSIISPAVPAPFPAPQFWPNGGYIDAFSTNHAGLEGTIQIDFSVDRTTVGVGALGAEAALLQQMGDIYRSQAVFPAPAAFVGTLGPGPFAGVLPSAGGGGGNSLVINQGLPGPGVGGFGLLAGGAVLPPGVPAGTIVMGSHDNVDAFDHVSQVPIVGPGTPGVYPLSSYFAVAPDEAASLNGGGGGPAGLISAADLFDVAPMVPGTAPVAYAPAASMGLDVVGGLNSDSIDALVLWDLNLLGGPVNNGPGAEPGIDFALFSLAPGSATLAQFNLDAADVFFTDFTGAFAVYAFAADLGVGPAPGGPPFGPSNVDALEAVPEPATFVLAAIGLLGVLGYTWRRRRAC